MSNFSDIIRSWQMFYATVAAACATLTGLLFIALTLNSEILRRDEDSQILDMARQAFSQFILVLMISLVFLIPHQSPLSLGIALLALSGAYAIPTGKHLWDALRRRRRVPGRRVFLRGVAFSLAGDLGAFAVGVAVLLHWWTALYILVFMLAAALGAASRYAWFLLTHRGTPGSGEPQQ